MKAVNHRLGDADIEKSMGNLLRYGVLISLFVILTGAGFYLFQHGGETPSYKKFLGEPKRLSEVPLVLHFALRGRGRSIIQLGLFILIATPIVRIIFSIVGYILEKDYLYIAITSVVLAIILFSLR